MIMILANYMRQQYLIWNKDSVSEEIYLRISIFFRAVVLLCLQIFIFLQYRLMLPVCLEFTAPEDNILIVLVAASVPEIRKRPIRENNKLRDNGCF